MKKGKISFEEIISDLRNKIYHPVYFLTGEEAYFIDKISDFISDNVLSQEEQAFNQSVLYGRETPASTILNAARRFPMMANHQVIIVREAQEMKDFELLEHYLLNPLKSTILVICYKYKKLDGRTKIAQLIKNNSLYFESEKIYNDKIPAWISGQLKPRNINIEPKAAVLLAEFLGNDLSKIENEIQKLLITLPENMNIISSAHIEKNIGISKDYNVFELQNALVERDAAKIQKIISYFAANPKNNHITMVITNLFFFFSKILIYHSLSDKSTPNLISHLKVPPYFIKDYVRAASVYPLGKVARIISSLREYDMKSKGYGSLSTEPADLMKELCFKIIH